MHVTESENIVDLKAKVLKEEFNMNSSLITVRFKSLLCIRRAIMTEKYFENATGFDDLADWLVLCSKGELRNFLQSRIKIYFKVNPVPFKYKANSAKKLLKFVLSESLTEMFECCYYTTEIINHIYSTLSFTCYNQLFIKLHRAELTLALAANITTANLLNYLIRTAYASPKVFKFILKPAEQWFSKFNQFKNKKFNKFTSASENKTNNISLSSNDKFLTKEPYI